MKSETEKDQAPGKVALAGIRDDFIRASKHARATFEENGGSNKISQPPKTRSSSIFFFNVSGNETTSEIIGISKCHVSMFRSNTMLTSTFRKQN